MTFDETFALQALEDLIKAKVGIGHQLHIEFSNWKLQLNMLNSRARSSVGPQPQDEYERRRIYDGLNRLALFLGEVSLLDLGRPTVSRSQLNETVSSYAKPAFGIITALPKEYVAVKVLLNNVRDYITPGRGAGRQYLIGEVPTTNNGKHTVVLSLADMGNNIAATRAALLLEHFPSIESIIMVGIAGGIPHPRRPDDHVRLGDIVVSDKGGVIQYDFIKETRRGSKGKSEITPRYPPRPPSSRLLQAVNLLRASELEGHCPWVAYLEQALKHLDISRPPEETDILVSETNPSTIVPHPNDPKRKRGQPRVFVGSIASANILLKNAARRDQLRDRFNVKAVEMEASGIADATWNHEVGYLVVRGICDYCDINKNDDWQKYAAVAAAAYTRTLIGSIPAVLDKGRTSGQGG